MDLAQINGNLARKIEQHSNPIHLVNKQYSKNQKSKYNYYKKKIQNKDYIEFAIDEIALELTHYLSKVE